MRTLKTLLPKLAAGAAVLSLSACSPAGGGGSGVLPAGETNLTCAALIYAANSVLDDGKATDPEGIIKDKYFGALTRYATAHAKAEGLEASGALGVVKLKAFRFLGIGSSGGQIASKTIVERAKACIAA